MEMRNRSRTLVTAHMMIGPVVDGSTATTLCGERIIVNAHQTKAISKSGDYIVCPLCEAAWELRDVQPPAPEQGSLW